MLKPGRTLIRTLRASTREPDRFGVQMRFESLLAGAELEPAGLGPSTIVCIRAVRAPAPSKGATEWNTLARKAVDASVRDASRPIRGAPPPSTNAVIFLDMAELLACLVMDAAAGRLSAHWWWRSLLGHQWPAPATVTQTWSEAAAHVPAALEHLARRNALAAVTTVAQPDDVLRAVVRTFGLDRLEDALAVSAPRRASKASRAQAATPIPATPRKTMREPPAQSSPWRAWVPEAFENAFAHDDTCHLVGIGLTLFRAPRVARSSAFAKAVATWRGRPAHTIQVDTPAQVASGEPTSPRALSSHSRSAETLRKAEIHNLQLPPAPPASERPREDVAPASPGATSPSHAEAEPIDQVAVNRAAPEPEPEVFDTGPLDAFVFETAYGGLFYLVTIALRLGFYGDFSQPAAQSIPLSPWDYLATVGLELLGEELQRDPIWSFLTDSGASDDIDVDLVQSVVARVREHLVISVGPEFTTNMLCCHHARVVVTAARIDVQLSLAELPIDIRRSGLDRDPGWVPAAGRAFAFHFE